MEVNKNGFKNAKLFLDEPRDIYYSGQVLSGYIECVLVQPLSYTVINVNFIGEADVKWTEAEVKEFNGVSRTELSKYTAHETYFNAMLCVSGGNGVVNLPPGEHEIPFKFQIPHSAPSSYTGQLGSVYYRVIAYIDYPDPSMQRDILEKAFRVVAPLDLNKGDDFKRPINIEFEEFYSCCCSKSPMNIRIKIPASGFCPGQPIPIAVCVENESDVEVENIKFELLEKVCYHSFEPSRSDNIPPSKIIQSEKMGAVMSSSKREVIFKLYVPDMIAPNLQSCNIIDVGYFIKVVIKLSGCNDDLEDEDEICLGLIPVASLVENYTHPLQSDLPQGAIPDPNFIMQLPVQNIAYQTSAANASSYPKAAPYPTSGPVPNVTPYPTNDVNQGIPMTNLLRTGNIGFLVSHGPGNHAPSPVGMAPYPGVDDKMAPYPSNSPSFPGGNVAPYPTSNRGNVAPYLGFNSPSFPGGNNAPICPYPTSNNAPYPVDQSYPPPYPGHNAPSAPPPSS